MIVIVVVIVLSPPTHTQTFQIHDTRERTTIESPSTCRVLCVLTIRVTKSSLLLLLLLPPPPPPSDHTRASVIAAVFIDTTTRRETPLHTPPARNRRAHAILRSRSRSFLSAASCRRRPPLGHSCWLDNTRSCRPSCFLQVVATTHNIQIQNFVSRSMWPRCLMLRVTSKMSSL